MQEKQLKHANKLINRLKHPLEPDLLWFFSNEKNFCQDQKNCPIQNHAQSHADKISSDKHGVTSNEGDVMLSHFFPEALKLNTNGYIHVLSEVVNP